MKGKGHNIVDYFIFFLLHPRMMTASSDYQARQRPRNVGKTMRVKPLGRLWDKNRQNLVFTFIFQWKKNYILKLFNHFYLLLSRADV